MCNIILAKNKKLKILASKLWYLWSSLDLQLQDDPIKSEKPCLGGQLSVTVGFSNMQKLVLRYTTCKNPKNFKIEWKIRKTGMKIIKVAEI